MIRARRLVVLFAALLTTPASAVNHPFGAHTVPLACAGTGATLRCR